MIFAPPVLREKNRSGKSLFPPAALYAMLVAE